METAAPDAELHAYLDAGDLRQAGTWLVQRHARDVLGLCGAMVRDAATAEDLTQDVFGRAFSGLGGYRREASSRTWLLAIARNRCIDHLRAMRRDPWRGAPRDEASADPDRVPDAAPLPAELLTRRAQVAAALDELAEGERALVVLRYRHGLDYRELSHVFGIRTGTLRMRLSRALSRMRRALERMAEETTDRHALASLAAAAPEETADALFEAGHEADLDELASSRLLEAPGGAPPPAPAAPVPASPGPTRRSAKARSRGPGAPRRPGLLRRLVGRSEPEAPTPPSDPLAASLGPAELPPRLADRLLALAQQLRG